MTTSFNRHEWIYDSEEPGETAPDYLDELLNNMEVEVDRYIAENPGFKPEKTREEITAAKEDRKSAVTAGQKRKFDKIIRDKEWMLANNRSLARIELMLENHRSVFAIKKWRGGWVGSVWVTRTEHQPVGLEESFVRKLLSNEAYEHSRFRSQEFQPLGKYDRQSTVDETRFRGVRMLSESQYQMVDSAGVRVMVTPTWAIEMVPSESLMDAYIGYCAWCDEQGRNDKGSFFLIPLGSQAAAASVSIPVAGTASSNEGSVIIPAADQVSASASKMKRTGPPIMFPNDEKERCLHRSFASALHFLGYKSQALVLLNETGVRSKESCHAPTLKQMRWRQFEAFKQSVMGCMSMYDKVRYRKARCGKVGHYDPTNQEHQNNNPIAASLKAARMVDGKKVSVQINHAVCFLGGYTFDSNQGYAMETCKETLDHVCTLVSPGSFYDGIFWARELVLDHKTARK